MLGGGPAAGAAALHLARSDFEVTLFVPERPGEKPCGGAVPAYLLDEVEPAGVEALPVVRSPRAVLENAAGRTVTLDLAGLRIFRRADLDAATLDAAEAAGARRVRSRARRLTFAEREVVVRTDEGEVAFDWLVAADGARGLSRRTLGLSPGATSLGLGASLSGIEVETLTLGFPDLGDAYLWIFPRPGGCSVGIAYSEQLVSAGAARAALETFVERHLNRPFESFDGVRYRYPIPVYSAASVRAAEAGVEQRVLLAGDAAGVADPLTREGIRHAARSGRLAADCLGTRLPAEYPRRLEASMGAEMDRAQRAAELFFTDPIGQWMVPVCRSHPGVRRVLGDLLACRQPYRGLRRRLLRAAVDRG